MSNFSEKIKYLVKQLADGKHTVFAKNCGIPGGTFQAYINGESIPRTNHLIKMASVYRINLNWLLLGEGEPFLGIDGEDTHLTGYGPPCDPISRYLEGLENEIGVSLTPEIRQSLLIMLEKVVEDTLAGKREVVKKLMVSFWGGKKDEGTK